MACVTWKVTQLYQIHGEFWEKYEIFFEEGIPNLTVYNVLKSVDGSETLKRQP